MSWVKRGAGTLVVAVTCLVLLAPTASAQDTGSLFVTSDPSGEDVYLNGKNVGETPITIKNLTAASYSVEIRSERYVDLVQDEIEVQPGELTSVAFALNEALGGLSLASDLAGATIVLDGEIVGQVAADTPFERAGLPIGAHIVELDSPFVRVTRDFTISKGETASVTITAAKAAGSVEVGGDVPIMWAQLDGQTLPGEGTYSVEHVAPGPHELLLGVKPVPYREIIEVQAGEKTSVQLKGGESLGTIIVSADVTADAVRVRIDDVLVSDTVPTRVQGVVAGGHVVEVHAVREADGIVVVAQKGIIVQPGETTLAAFAEGDLLTDFPVCPDDMVWIAGEGAAHGEYAFSQPRDEATPGIETDALWPSADDRDPYGRRDAMTIEAGGTTLQLNAAGAMRATHRSPSSEAKRADAAGSPLITSSSSGGAAAGAAGMMGGEGGMMGGPGMMGPGGGGMMGGPGMMGSGGGGMMGGPGMMGSGGGGMMGGGASGGGSEIITAFDDEGKRLSDPHPLESSFTNYIMQYVGITGHHYCIDKYEYPNFPGATPTLATYSEAESLCTEHGKRLCTATEWVRACSGPRSWLFPYGDQYDPSKCNTGDNPRGGGIAKSGSYGGCLSAYGVYDMSGNVAEWVVADAVFTLVTDAEGIPEMLTEPHLLYYHTHWNPGTSPRGSTPEFDTRGGSWLSDGVDAACGSFALRGTQNTVSSTITGGGGRGFRCCTEAEMDAEMKRMLSPRFRPLGTASR